MKRLIVMMIIVALSLCACGNETTEETVRADRAVATVSAVGDIFLTDVMLNDAKQPDGSYRFSSQFEDMIVPITQADIAFGNFEGTFSGNAFSAQEGSYPDELAAELSRVGFDLLQTANSYSIYNGVSGLVRTKQTIEDNGMRALGTYTSAEDLEKNQVVIREANGIRFAFVALTKGVGNLTIPDNTACSVDLLYKDYTSDYSQINTAYINALMEKARQAEPDVIIAGLHWGSENNELVSETQEEIADLLLKNGVDVILGSHSHKVGTVERRTVTFENGRQKECVIAYSLGDFCAADQGDCNTSAILNLRFERNGGNTLITDISHTPVSAVDRGAGYADRYCVVQTEAAIELYDGNYFDHVSKELYDEMLTDIERVREKLAMEP